MANLVRVSVLAPDDALRDYGPGALIRLERAATQAGVFAEVTTAPVVTNIYSYEIFDAAGSTTDWYRYRFSNALNTVQSAYTDPHSLDSPEAYATLDDLMLTMGQPISDTRFWANAERRLVEATRDLDREIGYSALRTTGTRIVHGDGTGLLHVHGGIVSLTSIDVRLSTGAAWTALQAQDTGWYLEGDVGDPNPVDGIYYHVRLIDTATYTQFPKVQQGVRLNGTLGGDAESRRAACIAWARQRIALDSSAMGGVVSGPEDLGGAVSIDRWPRAVYDLIASERHRFWCHL